MKSLFILQSYTPKEIEQIATGKKTIKLCKTAPKDTPFKVYMYCTNNKLRNKKYLYINEPKARKDVGYVIDWRTKKEVLTVNITTPFEFDCFLSNRKVIGEYVCDRIDKYNTSCIDGEDRLKETTCLDDVEIMDYMNGYTDRIFYGLHISELKIYDKPKALGEFFTKCNKIELYACNDCQHLCVQKCSYPCDDCTDTWCGVDNMKPVTRPPQSWMYVEELK